MEEKIKSLEMLQGIIGRLAQNSFMMKGWGISLLTAVIAVSIDKGKPVLILVGAFFYLFFWGLDAYYLYQEKIFRRVYEYHSKNNGSLGFNFFDITPNPQNMERWGICNTSYFRVLFSVTMQFLHIPLVTSAIVIYYMIV
ncbi:TPA: hypothetical protein RUW97_001033 [Aeromonas dhakensis]|uniref:hypothetical protein n=1 Tax=Aeromonas sp. TaxID=647 RepID=UPI00258C6E5A|nr:hypothetical protein [Aeromonas sp.]MCX7127116.1 hypothetical protein [Aeromonas sp.]HDZ8854685.1 hypothetical protein [Aeromonas dhakensis]